MEARKVGAGRAEGASDDGLRRVLGPVSATSIVIGAIITADICAIVVYGMHSNMKRTFMMTVRRLAGQA